MQLHRHELVIAESTVREGEVLLSELATIHSWQVTVAG
jgi:hypothetical protein